MWTCRTHTWVPHTHLLLEDFTRIDIGTDYGESASAHTHIDGTSASANGNFTFGLAFLFGDGWREDLIVFLDQFDEENCIEEGEVN